MMDKIAIEGVEAAAFPVGHPKDIAAFLLIEVDGISAGIDEQINLILEVCEKRNVREVKAAKDEAERERWWANRKTGFGAMGAISPDYLVQDGVIPRSKLPEVLSRIEEISQESGLRIANIFHAGTETFTRLSFSMPGFQAKPKEQSKRGVLVCKHVPTPVEPLRASMASGLRKEKKCVLSLRMKKLLPRRISAKCSTLTIY